MSYRSLIRHGAVGAVIFSVANFAAAQVPKPTDAEKVLAGKLQCEDWKRNPNGSWTGGPDAKIGSARFAAATAVPQMMPLFGADLATVLDQKCGAR